MQKKLLLYSRIIINVTLKKLEKVCYAKQTSYYRAKCSHNLSKTELFKLTTLVL